MLSFRNVKDLKGFSLIELLVVISIIVLLTTLAISSYGGFQTSSRDVKRQTDLKIVQSVLEQYHADQGFYASDSAIAGSGGVLRSGNPLTYGTKTYIKSLPTDPKSNNYFYEASPSGCSNTSSSNYCRSYILCARMEVTSSAYTTCSVSSSYNYEVTP